MRRISAFYGILLSMLLGVCPTSARIHAHDTPLRRLCRRGRFALCKRRRSKMREKVAVSDTARMRCQVVRPTPPAEWRIGHRLASSGLLCFGRVSLCSTETSPDDRLPPGGDESSPLASRG